MANEEKAELEVLLTCPVCRDIFREPRQLPCGHSMCMECLEGMIDHSSDVPFRCPDCRAYFGKIIGVQKSFALASIAEDYRENKKQRAKQTESVHCDYCPERTKLAVKTCLKCEVSLCQEHLKDHLELAVFTGHPLVAPLGDLQKRKCPQHEDEVLRYYCNTSRRYICNICALESKQLNVAAEASSILGRKLTDYMEQRFKFLERKIDESQDSIRKLQDDIQREKQKVNPGDSCLNSVTVVLLCLWFIVLYYAYSYSVENQTLTEALDKQETRVHHIYSSIADLLVGYPPLKDGRDEETEDPGTYTLDLDTASPFLGFSPDLRSVERVRHKLDYPSQKSRFDEAPQVLSTSCFTSGTHMWQVEAEGSWDIAVSYKSIERKAKDQSVFGKNAQSWSLSHDDEGQLFAYHNKTQEVLPAALQDNQIQVIVDIDKGIITFATIGRLGTDDLHEFQAKLTEPVCLGLGLYRVDPPSKASIVKVH
ncbi:E3 ubiquitin-protein ligase TRIM21-like isoform X2 [Myripristis murdjan]|uniref:E3 ubiquitin-protein ligase TRIM21-like isoform X2 n=1 Tax=Myripristis murdjan TaxID=586833 RepID=UPI001176218E|nr:E3 ubiquitin-protein ligase TRIM21-like isoform X2 [Myripristis murdjan]